MLKLSLKILFCVAVLSACTVSKPSKILTGMVPFEDQFIDEDLISVIEYKEFIYHLPDDQKSDFVPNHYSVKSTYDNPTSLYTPITGISPNQALAYCEWRSKVWNDKKLGYTFEFRIPDFKELKALSQDDLDKVEFVSEGGVVGQVDWDQKEFTSLDNNIPLGKTGFRCIVDVKLIDG